MIYKNLKIKNLLKYKIRFKNIKLVTNQFLNQTELFLKINQFFKWF